MLSHHGRNIFSASEWLIMPDMRVVPSIAILVECWSPGRGSNQGWSWSLARVWGRFIGSKFAGWWPVSDSVLAGCSVEETAQQIVPLGRGSWIINGSAPYILTTSLNHQVLLFKWFEFYISNLSFLILSLRPPDFISLLFILAAGWRLLAHCKDWWLGRCKDKLCQERKLRLHELSIILAHLVIGYSHLPLFSSSKVGKDRWSRMGSSPPRVVVFIWKEVEMLACYLLWNTFDSLDFECQLNIHQLESVFRKLNKLEKFCCENILICANLFGLPKEHVPSYM